MKKSRYMIASRLTTVSDRMVRQWYQDQMGLKLPVKNLHLTFVPPFHLLKAIDVEQLPQGEIITRAKAWGIYRFDNRQVLHLKLEPVAELAKTAEAIMRVVKDDIELLTKGYKDDRVPRFEAHLTLDYDYKGEKPKDKLPEESLRFLPPALMVEMQGGWQQTL